MKCISPISIKDPRNGGFCRMTVPCGKCGSCKFNRRVEWTYRIKEEFRHSLNGLFLTLTYDDANLPKNEYGVPELRKRDLQLFIKKVRKANAKISKTSVRYYCVGEYGTISHRPHYHAIMYNIDINIHSSIANIWALGHAMVGVVSDASIHYITKYHVNFDKKFSEEIGRNPEFATMSRKPGIGYQYIERAGSWNHDHGNVYVMNDGYAQRMPRYYKDKIFNEFEREVLADAAQKHSEDMYQVEYDRLFKKGIEDPDKYIEDCLYEASLKVLKKGREKLTL